MINREMELEQQECFLSDIVDKLFAQQNCINIMKSHKSRKEAIISTTLALSVCCVILTG